ncbi:TVP38/TMEM64 family protein [Skermanella mucosa]|uniref:TVP38/TMEM64 family protein n=1 Tax=Skermanella mucosa TaxID=1789672 RepID=UPI00192B5C3A|nr:TVP38/TMEM64 family protein [Skermanella mucosa]UEM20047.1 TVP38/TMEM64 family protein [Skermanella mucosa]
MAAAEPMSEPSNLKRFLPLAVLAAGLVAFFALGLHRYLNFSSLGEHRETLLDLVGRHPVAAPLGFIAVYAAAVAFSIPGAAVLTIAGGFMFGTLAGGIYVVTGATLGAVGVFLAARTALGSGLRRRAGPWMARLEAGFHENALSYLLVLRLVPLFPFWLVNLVPAFLGVPLGTYALGTFLGIIPGSFVYASVGNGVGAVFDAGGTPDLSIIFKPEILLPIAGLSLLALVPVIYKKFKGNRANG